MTVVVEGGCSHMIHTIWGCFGKPPIGSLACGTFRKMPFIP